MSQVAQLETNGGCPCGMMIDIKENYVLSTAWPSIYQSSPTLSVITCNQHDLIRLCYFVWLLYLRRRLYYPIRSTPIVDCSDGVTSNFESGGPADQVTSRGTCPEQTLHRQFWVCSTSSIEATVPADRAKAISSQC